MMPERIQQVISDASSWLVTAMLGGILWLVRRIFTNQEQIKALKGELRRDRAEMREAIGEVKDELKEQRADIKTLLRERR